jgi:uncharacterized protein (TIGR02231 family)
MKKIGLLSIFTVNTLVLLAQNAFETNAVLTHATVYYANGAGLEHSAKATISAGPQEVLINNISPFADVSTIKVSCPENVTLVNYRFNSLTVYPVSVNDTAVNKMLDSITVLQKQLKQLANDYDIQKEILQKTGLLIETSTGVQAGRNLPPAELLKLIDYYNLKTKEIKNILFAISEKQEVFSDSISQINSRIAERKKHQTMASAKVVGQLALQVIAKGNADAVFDISYFCKNAGWLPAYDLRAKSISNTCKLVYKATIHQSTGIGWNKAKLTLSTSNPAQGNMVPVLNPWFVGLYVPQLSSQLSEVVVVGYGSANREDFDDNNNAPRKKQYEKEKIVESSLVQAYTNLSESQLNVNYEIDLPYDIASDDKAITVAIKEEAVNASFRHAAMPKLDRDAFLLANITGWQKLNLMPGEANVILDNVYTGKSFIDPNTTLDTLAVSLGRDKRIAISRNAVKEFTKSRIKGDTRIEEYTYEIVVKNNKTATADIFLEDQLPVSKLKEIDINVTDLGNSQLNKETGLITWQISLQPGESKKYRFSYSIKYPADKKIASL